MSLPLPMTIGLALCMVFSAHAQTPTTVSQTGPGQTSPGLTPVWITSPNGRLQAAVGIDSTRHLAWSLELDHHRLVLPSALGITIAQLDLGQDVELGTPVFSTTDKHYSWQGVHHINTDHYRQALIPVKQKKSGIRYQLECRAFDDGFAFRYIVPAKAAAPARAVSSAKAADDSTLVTGEASSWRLPPGSRIWYQENIYYYEGLHYDTPIAALGAKQLGPPVTYQTPDGSYATITEAALYNYSGMSLRSDSSGTLHAAFINDTLGWRISGTVTTPWRVVLAAANLNDLVNADLIPDLNPRPRKGRPGKPRQPIKLDTTGPRRMELFQTRQRDHGRPGKILY